jgi:rod shape-determining protein MreC
MISVFGWSVRAPSQLTRLVLLTLLAGMLMALDHRGGHLEKIRAALAVLATPVHYVAALPTRVGGAVWDFFTSAHALRKEIGELKSERELLHARLQQFEALEAENDRLRGLLGSAQRVGTRALAADLIEVSAEPFTRKIILARGSRDGVYVGQPVIDAHGVMGQVTQVASNVARVTLITDPGHAIPVQVNRNGLRALVFGTGAADTLEVPYLTANADIKTGDLLVSSGLGGNFPAGYPVAQVVDIVNDPNESFLEITVKAVAHLNHSRRALLIWPNDAKARTEPAKPAKAPGK